MRLSLGSVLIALLAVSSEAQVIPSPPKRTRDQWVLSFSGLGGIPVGEFRKNENGGGGVEVMVGFQPIRRQPLKLRGQIDWLMYGRINRDVEEDYCDIFGNCSTETVYYDSRSHMMFTFQAGPELTPVNGKWRPFVFALAGSTVFHSYANLGYPNAGGPPSKNLFTSANFSTSYGGGIRVVDENEIRPGAFELAVHFTRNAKADYLTERGLTRTSSGTWIVRPVRGAANVVMIKAGFWIGPNVPWFER